MYLDLQRSYRRCSGRNYTGCLYRKRSNTYYLASPRFWLVCSVSEEKNWMFSIKNEFVTDTADSRYVRFKFDLSQMEDPGRLLKRLVKWNEEKKYCHIMKMRIHTDYIVIICYTRKKYSFFIPPFFSVNWRLAHWNNMRPQQ